MTSLAQREIVEPAGIVTATETKIAQYSIAVRAARLNSRPPVISALSGLHQTKAREIFRDITGTEPIKGQMPSDTSYYISDLHRHLESAWLVQTYRLLAVNEKRHTELCECMFLTYEQYLNSFSRPVITFDRFFFLVRYTFFGNEITISPCRECNSIKLSVKCWDPSKVVKCPICFYSGN